jgi:hypothetical protein
LSTFYLATDLSGKNNLPDNKKAAPGNVDRSRSQIAEKPVYCAVG